MKTKRKATIRDLLDDLKAFEQSPESVGYDLRLDLCTCPICDPAQTGAVRKPEPKPSLYHRKPLI